MVGEPQYIKSALKKSEIDAISNIIKSLEKNLEKARLKRKIAELQERYDQLDQNDSDGE